MEPRMWDTGSVKEGDGTRTLYIRTLEPVVINALAILGGFGATLADFLRPDPLKVASATDCMS